MNETLGMMNAVIESAEITTADYGLLTVWLRVAHERGNQGFGGYSLYLPESFSHHELLSTAGHFIWRCMEIADVTEWSDMPSKTIRVSADHSHIEAIGHIVKNDWFCPHQDFKHLNEKGKSA